MDVGDTVILKSGGPLMVIEKLQGNDKALCIWFGAEGLEIYTFPIAVLHVMFEA